jgi:ribosomal protein S12 methylthiotransferase
MKYHLLTLGCPKNSVDSEGMGSILATQGHTSVDTMEDADVIIVNTCSFIQPARDETLDVLYEVAQNKRPHQRLIAAGCLLQSHPHLAQTIPGIDATLSTRRWMDIGRLVQAPAPAAAPAPPTSYADWRTMPFKRHASTPYAYLKVSDGCNLHCAFCTIPSIKGPMRSKPVEALCAEARQLVEQGVQELILVAQHLTDYGRDLGMPDGLATLLDALCAAIPAHTWLRLMYAYPHGITPRLVETMARHPQICAYLDMPLQHAHPDTLRRMHRPADVDQTQRTIAHLRQTIPHITLRSTFIVGFPGETHAEFQTLLDFLREMQFERVGIFPYSREEGTPAATLPGHHAPGTIEQRWHTAMQLQQGIAAATNRRWLDKQLAVLIEGEGVVEDGRPLVVGRSFRDAPEIDGQVLLWGNAPIGRVVSAHITETTEYDLWGTLVDEV